MNLNNLPKILASCGNQMKVFRRLYTPRRALLYVPGDDIKKINKTNGLDVDCVVLDCEDGVALNKKDAARTIIRDMLDKGKPQKDRPFDWGVRVNSVDSGLCKNDLQALLTAKNLPDTVSLPKVETTEHIKWFSDQVDSLVKQDKKVNLIIFIESAIAFLNLVDICKAADTLSKQCKIMPCALVYGGDDFVANIGATKTEEGLETLYARQKLVLVAKAFNLQAIDMVYIKFKDLDGLRKQSEQGSNMGYTGKQVIHPGQVPIVQDAFLPNSSKVEWATGLLKSFEEHQKTGKGAFTYKGSMIDMPTMKQAKNIVDTIKILKK
ncbi:citramalyl-CoA lyase, mitochondrial [Aethina tumida]|uniref:citramalyl-CoA lyase, mitochondrial n=1 Tax=Aethina tumida TaxID=116153 RepID=UPI00096AFF6F|nr:citramalyl-CoA lyase, mitochondrial [Aethina tumida]